MITLELILVTKESQFADNLSELVQEMKKTPSRTSLNLTKDLGLNNQVLLIDEDAIANQPENNLSSLRTLFPFSLQILFVEAVQKKELQNYLGWGCNALVMKTDSIKKMKKAILLTCERGFYLNDNFKTLLNMPYEEEKVNLNIKGKQPQRMN
ncbi:MAG: hypothetical protein KTR26_16300 [Flammeovirgaceae bacterium]|nr:hypothetical protein [Flammeovirgaceae bacterium]